MTYNQNPHLGFILFSFLLITVSATSSLLSSVSASGAPTVYEILQKFGLPSGLLPDSVTSYSLSDDGSFVVELENPCYIQFDYLVYYDKRITGKLSYGSITKLEGIQVQKFFFWLNVDEIKVDLPPSDSIYFQVGLINKKLDVDQFKTVHSCRDGVSSSCGPITLTKSITDLHDLLPKYGLPKGLLPNVVKSYTLSPDGTIEVELERACYVQFEELVYYDKKIKGKLSYGSVSEVSGIQAKKMFLWVPVTGMDADIDSGMIEFHVGILSQKLPAEQFETIPSCKNKACQRPNIQSL